MKKQIKKFDASKYEILQRKGEVLKGGFSSALTSSVSGGKSLGTNIFSCPNIGCNNCPNTGICPS
ncbi:MAG: hypothetical protein ACI7YS_11150 [Flavobacterium sp.]